MSSSGKQPKQSKRSQQQQQQQPQPQMMPMMAPPPGMYPPPLPHMGMPYYGVPGAPPMMPPGMFAAMPCMYPPPPPHMGMMLPPQPMAPVGAQKKKAAAKKAKAKKVSARDLELAVYDQWNNNLVALVDYIGKIKPEEASNINLVKMILDKTTKSDNIIMRKKPMEMVIEKLKPYKDLIGNKDSTLFTEHAENLGQLKHLKIGQHWATLSPEQQNTIWSYLQMLYMTGEAFSAMKPQELQATGAMIKKIAPKPGDKPGAGGGMDAMFSKVQEILGGSGGIDLGALSGQQGALGIPADAAKELQNILSQATTSDGGLDMSALMASLPK